MDIFEQWHKIEQEKFNQSPIKKEDIMNAIYQKSTGTMETLKTRLKYKMVWVLFFTGFFTGLALWQLDNTSAALIFAGAAVLYAMGFLGLRRFYTQMGVQTESGSTLDVMKENHELITGALKFESNVFLAMMPAMLVGAVLVPGLIEGKELTELITQPKLIIILLVAMIIMTPLVKFVGDRMNKFAYGSFIEKLKRNIKEMEMVG